MENSGTGHIDYEEPFQRLPVGEHLKYAAYFGLVPFETTTDEPISKRGRFKDNPHDNSTDMQSVLSKMISLDCFPFKMFTSLTLRQVFQNSNYDLPTSPDEIKNIVRAKCQVLKNDLINEICVAKAKGHKFSVSLSKWTSAINKHYMNVYIHSPPSILHRNLGVLRITSRASYFQGLKEQLSKFELSISHDIICIVTDSASNIRSWMSEETAPALFQQCIAYGIQCAVLQLLYNKSSLRQTNDNSEPENLSTHDLESEGEEDEDMNPLSRESIRAVPIFLHKDIIYKARRAVKMLKLLSFESEVRSELILDNKISWGSLADMISSFLSIEDEYLKALGEVVNGIKFTGTEMAILKDLSFCLNVIKATVEAVCKKDANLINAEIALKFMISKLTERNSELSRTFSEALKLQIFYFREPLLVGTLKYLHNPAQYYAERTDGLFKNPSSETIAKFISKISEKYFRLTQTICTSVIDLESDSDEASVDYQQNERSETPLNLTKELSKEIQRTLSNTSFNARRTNDIDLESYFRTHMAVFERGGAKSVYLTKVHDFLLTIPPASIDADNAFSASPFLDNRLKTYDINDVPINRIAFPKTSKYDETVDCLTFLRSYYIRNNR